MQKVSDSIWYGPPALSPYLVPIETLRPGTDESDYDLEQFVEALRSYGQVRPVLLAADGRIAERGYLAEAALALGWTHIAARLEIAETATTEAVAAGQLSIVDEVESTGGDVSAVAAATRELKRQARDDDVDAINAASANVDHEWVGLPEFVPSAEPWKVYVSCDSEADRDALLSLLGIATIHKGTRGTLSVWWPDREKEDLSSLRFEVATNGTTEPEEDDLDALIEVYETAL